MTVKISQQQARRFLFSLHGLDGQRRFKGEAGILEWIRQAGCIQYDPIDICGKNHELVLQSRVEGFRRGQVETLLYGKRVLLDGWDKNMAIYPVEDHPYFARKRAQARESRYSTEAIARVRGEILDRIRTEGPLSSKELAYAEKIEWHWAPTNLARAALERLYHEGVLLVHHKAGTRKYYDLAARHLPAGLLDREDPNPEDPDVDDWFLRRRIGSVGLLWNRGSDAWLGWDGVTVSRRKAAFERLLDRGELLELDVADLRWPLYILTEHRGHLDHDGDGERLAFLAPLDNMMWDRNLIEALFGFKYRWEIYTPAAKRQYGYYVLPMVRHHQFVGRVELVRDSETRKTRMEQIWWEPGMTGHEKAFDQSLSVFREMMDA